MGGGGFWLCIFRLFLTCFHLLCSFHSELKNLFPVSSSSSESYHQHCTVFICPLFLIPSLFPSWMVVPYCLACPLLLLPDLAPTGRHSLSIFHTQPSYCVPNFSGGGRNSVFPFCTTTSWICLSHLQSFMPFSSELNFYWRMSQLDQWRGKLLFFPVSLTLAFFLSL